MSDHKHSMTGAWALNALEDSERAEIEAYLEQNPEAAEEARSLSETAAHLAAAAGEQTPPPRAKQNIMAAIRQTRQLPPQEAGDPASAAPDVAASQPAESASPTQPTPASETMSEEEADVEVVSLADYRRKQHTLRLLSAAAAVLLLSTGALTGVVMVQQNELDSTQAQLAESLHYQEMAGQIMAASDAKMANLPSSEGGRVHLSYSATEGMMILSASALPELPEDRAYELWLISDDGASPAGMLSEAQAAGREPKMLEGSMEGVTHIGITVEPATGSEQPTTDPIVLSEL
ncbi:anti-sigma factor domain-containing protein [Brevibacterium litoralis]|uniref:anti-sigma factor n=1 Tax=Brevibacterium litoralis TaxID=3138935 RepID=UPI0032EAD102